MRRAEGKFHHYGKVEPLSFSPPQAENAAYDPVPRIGIVLQLIPQEFVQSNRLVMQKNRLSCGHMKRSAIIAAFVLLAAIAVFASPQEDKAADSVATAFMQARDQAHLSKLERMGGNIFREKVCKHDLRFASGAILTAQYQTSDPGNLPEVAQRLAVHRDDGYRVTTRFGIGVCSFGRDKSGQSVYSVLIATYESRWNSFLRIFWE